jgi:hypothetical protein
MATPMGLRLWAAAALVGLGFTATVQAQQASMTFFVTSVGKGDGANLGGLDGADAHCQALAKAAGATKTSWRAYLSTTAPGGDAGVSARERIGKGPWQNAKGVVVAKSIDELHSASTNLDKQSALTEKGEVCQWPRRCGEYARYPNRLRSTGHVLHSRRRYNLWQLEQERGGVCHRRPS